MFFISRLSSTSCAAAAVAGLAVCAAPQAEANLLTNPGFEDANLTAGDVYGAPGWTSFNGAYTVHTSVLGTVGANSGDHAFKVFGQDGGTFQQFAVNAGDTVNASVVALNWSGDQMGAGQVAAINLEWKLADGNTNSSIVPFISNGTFVGSTAPVDQWTELNITGVAPADAEFVRMVLITGNYAEGAGGGAPFFDDAFVEITPVPEPGSLALLGLGGIAMLRRRRRA